MLRYPKKTNIPTFKYSTIALTLFTLNPPSLAEQNTTSLDTINISENLDSRTSNTPNIIKKNVKNIQTELIRDTRDLVRYTTDIGISDNGQRLKGFAIRGVEGNRVGISIDSVSLPDSEENSLGAVLD